MHKVCFGFANYQSMILYTFLHTSDIDSSTLPYLSLNGKAGDITKD